MFFSLSKDAIIISAEYDEENKTTKEKLEELEKLSRGILQCARISLLLFLQIDSP